MSKSTAEYDGYFPVPVFLGDGKEWNLDLIDKYCGVYIRDLRDVRGPIRELKIRLNRVGPIIRLGADQSMADRGVNHVHIKTIKSEKFALLLIDRPWTTHTGSEFTPLSKSVSVYSDVDHVIELNKKFHGFGGNWVVTEYSDSGNWK